MLQAFDAFVNPCPKLVPTFVQILKTDVKGTSPTIILIITGKQLS